MLTRRIWLIALIVAGLSCTSKTDGPSPEITGVTPAIICTAQSDVAITLSGSGFSPAVVDGLTDDERVAMPRVFLVGESGETEIPAAGVSLPDGDTSGTALEVVIPQGLVGPTANDEPEAIYDIRVENPNGNAGTLTGALTVVPPPRLVAVDPTFGAQDSTVTVTLTGTGFRDGMTVTLDASPAVEGTDVTVTSSTEASASFDLTDVAAGVYSITVANSDGCTSTLEDAFQVIIPEEFELVGVEPPFGCTCARTTVTIKSQGGFVSTPRVEMRPNGATTPVIKFENVAFVDEDTLTAVVPDGAPLGDYDVTVLNPPSDAGVATLENGFRVVADPPPTIEAVVPARGSPNEDTPVSIFGENFRPDVTVELIDRDGNVEGSVTDVTPVDGTQIDVTLPTAGMTEDAYLLRVTNLDQLTHGTFSSFLVAQVGPSGNLGDFVSESTLNTGRRMLAGTAARDDNGNAYVYAIGGDTGDGGNVLDTVEVAQISSFGDLGAWSDFTNPMGSPRAGADVVAVPIFDPDGSPFVPIKTYLYILGGSSDGGTTVLDSIERAVVLSPNDAPTVTAGASLSSGTLDPGTWYYKVSAVLSDADPDNPGGETLPSDEAIITIGGGTSAITLSWDPVEVNGMAAESYRIYRTDAVNGVSQTEHLIAEGITETTYTDTGAEEGTLRPLAPGSPGVWVTEENGLETARWGHRAVLLDDPDGGSFLHVLGGKSDDANGYLASVEFATVDAADGSLGTFSATHTDNETTPLSVARAFFAIAVETPQNVAAYPGSARIFIYGGVADGVGNQASSLFESSDILAGGANDAWVEHTIAGTFLGALRAGAMAIITAEKFFLLGGAASANDTSFSNIQNGGSDVPFESDDQNDGTNDGDIYTPSQDIGTTIGGSRALGASVTRSGFIYLFGGTSDGTDALDTTVQALTTGNI